MQWGSVASDVVNARFNEWATEVDVTEAMKEPSRLSALPRRASTTPTLA